MAKMKKAEGNEPVVEQEVVQEVDTTKENAEVEKTDVVEPETEAAKVEASAEQKDDIPENVLAYLKSHPDVKEVYFDKLGGVFSADTPKAFLKGAVLYQNPFFKQ